MFLSPQNEFIYKLEETMKIGYARVSTTDQNPELQMDGLVSAGCEKFYTDKASGTKEDRPALKDMMKNLRPGDTVVVWKLDRLGRSLKHLMQIVDELKEKGVSFISTTEGFDTTTCGGKLFFQIFGALAEFEHNIIVERTNAGLAAARARGKKGGRKAKLTGKDIKILKKLYDDKSIPVAGICKRFDISRPTMHRYLAK
jgi:DNA invertase Pin-like site-specific DNA recombinase